MAKSRKPLNISIDVSAMAKAVGKTPELLLEDWAATKGGQRLQTALKNLAGTPLSNKDYVEALSRVAAHFVRKEPISI